jgi:uncharacterized protein YhfF
MHSQRAVIETIEITRCKIADVDAKFAFDYGEWDRTLETWRREVKSYYGPIAERRGLPAGNDIELLCERFRVIWAG